MKQHPFIEISFPAPLLRKNHTCNCDEAHKKCLPSFVFSISGQVGFRQALHHLTLCADKNCHRLKMKIIIATQKKLKWLLKENALLGCIHLQPFIYGKEKILLSNKNFAVIARHLAHCPKESCAQLRRSALLTIKKILSPKQTQKIDL